MKMILIGGLWLDGSAWDAVLEPLRAAGHEPVALTLPGQGADCADGRPARDATLDDELDAVLAAIDAASEPVLVVGHSAACTLAWLAADRRPDAVAGVALIGGFPNGDGEQYAPFFELEYGVMPFPGWGPFEGADSADLAPEQKDAMAAAAHPVPGGVAHGVVRYEREDRGATPVTLVCPEFSPAEAREWIAGNDMDEAKRMRRLELIDLESGHWPMLSAPDALARELAGAADALR